MAPSSGIYAVLRQVVNYFFNQNSFCLLYAFLRGLRALRGEKGILAFRPLGTLGQKKQLTVKVGKKRNDYKELKL